MIWALILGIGFGACRGLAPGPTLALVLATRAREGGGAAVAAVVGPLVTEGALLATALASVGQFSQRALGIVGLLGALFCFRLAWDIWDEAASADPAGDASQVRVAKRVSPFQRGLVAGALSVYAAIFWLTIAGPITVRLHGRDGLGASIVFTTLALLLTVAVRLATAFSLGGTNGLVAYRGLLRGTALAYSAFGALVAIEAARLAISP